MYTTTNAFHTKIASDFVRLLGEEPNSEEVRCQCPFSTCRDSPLAIQKTLAVNIVTGKYYCFRCHASGHPSDIARHLLNKSVFTKYSKNRASATRLVAKKPPKLITVKVSMLPESARNKVLADLRPRKIFTDDEIDDLNFCVAGTLPQAWKNRVIIQADGLSFGKRIAGFESSDGPKYLTPTGFSLYDHGYIGMSSICRDTIILAEGILDYKSLPEGSAIMSPGTSGMCSKLLVSAARDHDIVVVPDSDKAGIEVFVRALNKGLIGASNTIRFSFVYWITGKRSDDINDLLRSPGMTPEEVYRVLLEYAATPSVTLNRLAHDWGLTRTGNIYRLPDDKETNVDHTGSLTISTGADLSWF